MVSKTKYILFHSLKMTRFGIKEYGLIDTIKQLGLIFNLASKMYDTHKALYEINIPSIKGEDQ